MSNINDLETPGFDPVGRARDEAFRAIPDIQSRILADLPTIGTLVEVVSGKNKGTTGRVFWVGKKRNFAAEKSSFKKRESWAMSDHLTHVGDMRVGIMTGEGEKIFSDADRIEVKIEKGEDK